MEPPKLVSGRMAKERESWGLLDLVDLVMPAGAGIDPTLAPRGNAPHRAAQHPAASIDGVIA